MALARSWLGARRSRCWRIQTLRSSTSGFACSWRTATRSAGILPLMVRSISNNSSILRTASAAIGDRQCCEIKEVPAAVAPARRLDNRRGLPPGIIETVEARERIGLHDAGVTGEMFAGMIAGAVARVVEHRRGRILAAKRAVVADIGPDATGDGLELCQYRHRRVIGMNALGAQNIASKRLNDRV